MNVMISELVDYFLNVLPNVVNKLGYCFWRKVEHLEMSAIL